MSEQDLKTGGGHEHQLPAPESNIPSAKHQNPHSSLKTDGNEPPEDLFDFSRLYFLVLKRLWIIGTVVMVGMLVVTARVLSLPKLYESRAVLQVELKEKKILTSDDVIEENSTTPDYLNTVSQEVTSGNVLLRVIKSNHLDENPSFAKPLSGGRKYSDDELIALIERKISVNLRRQTRIIDIIAEDRNPIQARDLAVSIEKEFFREAFEQRMSVNRIASEFLAEEADKLKVKLEESEQKLQRYKEENKAVSLEQNQNIVQEKLHDINAAYTEAKNARLKLEADLEKLRLIDPKNTDALLQISSVANLKDVVDLQTQLAAAESELATMRGHYLDKNPKHLAAVNKLEGLKADLAKTVVKASGTVTQQYDSILQTERKIAESLKDQEQSALELSKLSINYNVLLREVQTDQAMYDSVISRMKETRVQAGVESAPFRVIQNPMIPSKPSKPKRGQIMIVAFVLLVMGSIGGVIVYDMCHPGIRTLDDAETRLHLQVLGAIPNIELMAPELLARQLAREQAILPKRRELLKKLFSEISTRKKSLKDLTYGDFKSIFINAPQLPDEQSPEAKSMPLIADPSSQISEAYRTLRTSINMLLPLRDYQVLLFSSAIPDEGKSYTSKNCAIAFAQQGLRTLIIDGDLRRPTLHKTLMDGEVREGFTDYLAGSAKIEDIITPTKIEGLSMITSGKGIKNPAEILAQVDLKGMVDLLKSRFDKIIFDSAPINAVSDTLHLVAAAQKVILIIRAESTPLRVITRALKLLRSSGGTVAGVVLNRMSRGSSSGYYYYYYGDKYLKDSVYGASGRSKTPAS
jgi:capsular exopolysaccharide synthesis family protein